MTKPDAEVKTYEKSSRKERGKVKGERGVKRLWILFGSEKHTRTCDESDAERRKAHSRCELLDHEIVVPVRKHSSDTSLIIDI